MSVIRIPLKHYGQEIGSAVVDDNSVVTFILNHGTHQFGEELKAAIDSGRVTGLSVSPIIPPALRTAPPTNPNRHFTIP